MIWIGPLTGKILVKKPIRTSRIVTIPLRTYHEQSCEKSSTMSDPHDVPDPTPTGSLGGKRKRRMTARWRYTNQLNARASTGPRTAAGKARVARNALSHGLSVPLLKQDPTAAAKIDELARLILQSFFGPRGAMRRQSAEQSHSGEAQ